MALEMATWGGWKGKLGLLLIVEVGCGHQIRLRMKEVEESGKVIAWTQLKLITKIMPDASQGACDTDRGSHLPKHGLEFLLAALLWGNLTLSLRPSSWWARTVKGGFGCH